MRFFRYIKHIQLALYALALVGLVVIILDISKALNIAAICVWGLALLVMIADHMLKLPERRLEAQLMEEEESQRRRS